MSGLIRMRVSVLIVSFNTRDYTLACLRSVFRYTRQPEVEVIVIDNASIDNSAQLIASEFPQARLIVSTENLGFAAANNRAAEHARGEYLLLLNPDTLLQDDAVAALCDFADRYPDAGIYGGRTLHADGRLNPSSCWRRPSVWGMTCRGTGLGVLFRGRRWFDPEPMGWWQRDDERDVDIISGCFLLIQRQLWQRLQGFDPSFFMYAEDYDLCLRAHRLGARPRVTPYATIIHHGSASEPIKEDQTVRQFRARALLFRRHWSRLGAWWGIRMLDLWALRRAIVACIGYRCTDSDRDLRRAWRLVWKRRSEWHLR